MGKVGGDESIESLLRAGIGYAVALGNALKSSGLDGPFRVFVGADADSEYPSVTVRYHRIRPGQVWLPEDIEGFENGILAIDFETTKSDCP